MLVIFCQHVFDSKVVLLTYHVKQKAHNFGALEVKITFVMDTYTSEFQVNCIKNS